MKKTALWVLRHLLIPAGFIWTTGIFTLFHQVSGNKGPADPTNIFTDAELKTLEMTPENIYSYGDSLIAERKRQIKETGIYDPYLYFHDLKQYRMFEKVYGDSLMGTIEGRTIILSCLSQMISSRGMGQLLNLRDDNWRNKDFDAISAQSYTQNAGYMRKAMGITQARHYWFPADAARDLEIQQAPPIKIWPDFILPILLWFGGIYLKGLPFAFVLFLIWKIRFKKEFEEATWGDIETMSTKLRFDFRPLSFAISLLFWPVVLWADIRNRWNESIRKAEVLSRRKNMFSTLSKSEEKLIEIGKKMSLKEFREHLENIGKMRRHSFVSAIAVTIFLILIPRIVIPSVCTVEIFHSQTIITNTDYGGIDRNTGHACNYDTVCHFEAVVPLIETHIALTVLKVLHCVNRVLKILSGFLDEIGGIPRVANQFDSKLILISELKNWKHEKHNNDSYRNDYYFPVLRTG